MNVITYFSWVGCVFLLILGSFMLSSTCKAMIDDYLSKARFDWIALLIAILALPVLAAGIGVLLYLKGYLIA